jgi:hypothetical protein
MQPFAGLLVTGIPVDVQTVSPASAMMAECIGIKIASAARGTATSCIGGIANETQPQPTAITSETQVLSDLAAKYDIAIDVPHHISQRRDPFCRRG